MADNKQHDTAPPAARLRDGNPHVQFRLVVSGYFKKDTTTTAADKMARVLERKPLLRKNRQFDRL